MECMVKCMFIDLSQFIVIYSSNNILKKVLFLFWNYLSQGIEGLESKFEGLLKAWKSLPKKGTQFWFPSPTFIISKPYIDVCMNLDVYFI